MELAIPLLAAAGLYVISNQSSQNYSPSEEPSKEGFYGKNLQLPNENIPDKNYPEEYPVSVPELDRTSYLSVNHRYDGNGAYTDKFFNPYVKMSGSEAGSGRISKGGATSLLTGSGLSGDTESYSNEYLSDTKFYSMTGKQVTGDYFSHNNMVPFFGSHLRNQHGDVNFSESVLDNLIGSGSQTISKTEQSPLFSPHENLQWALGMPSQTDFIQSRINPSTKMTGVKPFADEKVGPGLGLGYTTEASGGYNSGMFMRESWVDRGVDELRVENKPKSSGHLLFGHEGPADSYVKYTADSSKIGAVEKNRPDTHFEMGQERYFTTKSAATAPALRTLPLESFSHRGENNINYVGNAGNGTNGLYVSGEYMPSHNNELGAYPILSAAASGKGNPNNHDYGINSQLAYPNNRMTTQEPNYYGIIGGAIGAVVAPLLDSLRPSRRENTVGALRQYQNPKSSVTNGYLFNPNDRLPPTIRETTGDGKQHMNINANQRGTGYVVTENQAVDTNRMTTSDYYYAGGSSAVNQFQRPRAYDPEYSQRNNDLKSSTIEGYMVKGNMELLNGEINMTSKPKEKYLYNGRPIAPNNMPSQTPDQFNMGKIQGSQELYQTIQLDRNSPDILSSLSGNPFALNVLNGI